MTINAYEDYLSKKEWECFQRGIIREYSRFHPMSIDERQQVLRWALLGHDIHSNPDGWTDDSGEQLDYLSYLRTDPAAQRNRFLLRHKNAGVYTTASSTEGGVAG